MLQAWHQNQEGFRDSRLLYKYHTHEPTTASLGKMVIVYMLHVLSVHG